MLKQVMVEYKSSAHKNVQSSQMWEDVVMSPSKRVSQVGSIRALNRERITEAIVLSAREQIATAGAGSLSMRAIARELGMASSAIYRYFESRDQLLTRLIVDSYDSLGAYAEQAVHGHEQEPIAGRFRLICHAARNWAQSRPHEFYLIYGSPVPGYQAPQDTIEPATRFPRLLIELVVASVWPAATAQAVAQQADAPASRASAPYARAGQLAVAEQTELDNVIAPMRTQIPEFVPADLALAGVTTYASLIGAIAFELGGQLTNVITDTEQARTHYFDYQVDLWLIALGWS